MYYCMWKQVHLNVEQINNKRFNNTRLLFQYYWWILRMMSDLPKNATSMKTDRQLFHIIAGFEPGSLVCYVTDTNTFPPAGVPLVRPYNIPVVGVDGSQMKHNSVTYYGQLKNARRRRYPHLRRWRISNDWWNIVVRWNGWDHVLGNAVQPICVTGWIEPNSRSDGSKANASTAFADLRAGDVLLYVSVAHSERGPMFDGEVK